MILHRYKLSTEERDIIWFHSGFLLFVVFILGYRFQVETGWRVLGLVVVYNVLAPIAAWWRGHLKWWARWAFLLPLSILLVFPDWFLSSELGVLVFPNTGGPRLGTVPVAMAGMWLIPLFLVLTVSEGVERRRTRSMAVGAAVIVSLLLFVGSEAVLWRVPIWFAENVMMVGHVAIYVIIPEVLLGSFCYLGYVYTGRAGFGTRIGATFVLMLLYLGALSFFYLLIEKIFVGGI